MFSKVAAPILDCHLKSFSNAMGLYSLQHVVLDIFIWISTNTDRKKICIIWSWSAFHLSECVFLNSLAQKFYCESNACPLFPFIFLLGCFWFP